MIGFLEVLRVFEARGREGQFASPTEVVVNGLEVPRPPGRGVPSRITAATRPARVQSKACHALRRRRRRQATWLGGQPSVYPGELIIPGGLMLPFELFFFASYTCSGSGPCGPSGLEQALITIGFALAVAAPVVTSIYLTRRASILTRG